MPQTGYLYLHSVLGLVSFCAIAWVFSTNRSQVRWRNAFAGVAIQVVLAWLLIRLPIMRSAFNGLNDAVVTLQ
ncbi:MAG: Na+ dependent nucleoside transporter N-terminal domain-containing protein, partial [Gammaproteobacteria bacterium]|nr:Na+ dependent nucleoside transporter N-terminal domain-containing protein [Gammaproteobacteria bacterium]